MTRKLSRAALLALALLVSLVAYVASGTMSAHAQDAIAKEAVIDGKLAKDGSLSVTQVLTFDSAPTSLDQKLSLVEKTFDKRQYNFEIKGLKVRVDEKDTHVELKTSGDYATYSVPLNGAKKVEISYHVTGASHEAADNSTQFRWRFVQGFNIMIEKATITLNVPGLFRDVDCKAGPPAAPGVCQAFYGGTHVSLSPKAEQQALGAGEVMVLSLRFDAKTVASNDKITESWSLDRAFDFSMGPMLAALAALSLGSLALWFAHRWAGRDSGFANPTRIAEFRPVGEDVQEFKILEPVRPGQVGTLVDERVDPIDVTATILDLAIRGHLLIVELPRQGNEALDWSFVRPTTDPARDQLAAFEQHLLDAIAPADGSPVKVSSFGGTILEKVPIIQSELYDEMVRQGWYTVRPDDTRNRWRIAAVGVLVSALVILGLLVAFTPFGLFGLVLVVLALGLLFVSTEMPARTQKGASMMAGMMVLRQELLNESTNRMPKGHEYRELSEVLPYAVVLGGADRWLAALVETDDDVGVPDPEDLSWYHGPENWEIKDLPNSLDQFITTMTGRLFRRS